MAYKREPFPTNPPSIKNAKPKTSTPVKHFPGLGIAPTIKQAKKVDKDAFNSNFKKQA
jgi:hypothetical protein|tara:strand:+ start:357 stop:530 length:174 start_codon:yes stop_codon:yes gene_type:complete